MTLIWFKYQISQIWIKRIDWNFYFANFGTLWNSYDKIHKFVINGNWSKYNRNVLHYNWYFSLVSWNFDFAPIILKQRFDQLHLSVQFLGPVYNPGSSSLKSSSLDCSVHNVVQFTMFHGILLLHHVVTPFTSDDDSWLTTTKCQTMLDPD